MTVTSRHVRVAGLEDARAIAEVHVASWLAAYRGIIDDEVLDGLSVDARAARWVENLTDPEADATTLLVDDGVVVGFAGIGRSRDEDRAAEGCGELYAIYLHPDHWGRGAGRALMDDALGRLRAGGYDDATLWVLTDNVSARRFYEHTGWEHEGTAKMWKASVTATPIEEVRYRIELS